jgi:hypothetical protein
MSVTGESSTGEVLYPFCFVAAISLARKHIDSLLDSLPFLTIPRSWKATPEGGYKATGAKTVDTVDARHTASLLVKRVKTGNFWHPALQFRGSNSTNLDIGSCHSRDAEGMLKSQLSHGKIHRGISDVDISAVAHQIGETAGEPQLAPRFCNMDPLTTSDENTGFKSPFHLLFSWSTGFFGSFDFHKGGEGEFSRNSPLWPGLWMHRHPHVNDTPRSVWIGGSGPV